MTNTVLAQLNIAKLRFELDSPELSEFVANLDRINQLAESTEGFIWRFLGDKPAETEVFGNGIIVNLSTWTDIKSLHQFVYRSDHKAIMRKREHWFEPLEIYNVLWWQPANQHPSLDEAKARLTHLAENGSGPQAFTFRNQWPAP